MYALALGFVLAGCFVWMLGLDRALASLGDGIFDGAYLEISAAPEILSGSVPGAVVVTIDKPGEFGIYSDRDASLSFEVRGPAAPAVNYAPPPQPEDSVMLLATFVADDPGEYEVAAHKNEFPSTSRARLLVCRVPTAGDPEFGHVAELLRRQTRDPDAVIFSIAGALFLTGVVLAGGTLVLQVATKKRSDSVAAP